MCGLDITIDHGRVNGSGQTRAGKEATQTGLQENLTTLVTKIVQFFGQEKRRSFGMTLTATSGRGMFAKKVGLLKPNDLTYSTMGHVGFAP